MIFLHRECRACGIDITINALEADLEEAYYCIACFGDLYFQNKNCECGAKAINSNFHSHYCPRVGLDETKKQEN